MEALAGLAEKVVIHLSTWADLVGKGEQGILYSYVYINIYTYINVCKCSVFAS